MTTYTAIVSAVDTIAHATGELRSRIGIEYREGTDGAPPWIARVVCDMAGRSKSTISLEGYGASPGDAAAEVVGAYARRHRSGGIRTREEQAPHLPPPECRVCGGDGYWRYADPGDASGHSCPACNGTGKERSDC